MTHPSQDLEHLRLLSIFHYVVAAVAALFTCFPLLYTAIGVAMVMQVPGFEDAEPAGILMGWFMIAFSAAFVLMGLAYAACTALAGRYLWQRRHYTFCLVMAAVTCLFMPFGTVLGVFTIIVLVRDSVKELFGRPRWSAEPEGTATAA
jgi:hypothetical protein